MPALLPGFLAVSMSITAQPDWPAPALPADDSTFGTGIQRTMTLLATSTPEHRHTVRVLFYGQSITQQDWWKQVADDLRARFPNANLVIENRAIGGFASQLLVKTSEADLYPWYPDLLIFHVYGSHIEYENLIRRVRERTTAEILMSTDHANHDEDLDEETDADKLTTKQWSAWMNHVFPAGHGDPLRRRAGAHPRGVEALPARPSPARCGPAARYRPPQRAGLLAHGPAHRARPALPARPARHRLARPGEDLSRWRRRDLAERPPQAALRGQSG